MNKFVSIDELFALFHGRVGWLVGFTSCKLFFELFYAEVILTIMICNYITIQISIFTMILNG